MLPQATPQTTTRYPHLANYIFLLEESAAINPLQLSRELDAMADEAIAQQALTPQLQDLTRLVKHAAILRGLLDVRLSRDEWAYYQAHRGEFDPQQWIYWNLRLRSSTSRGTYEL